MVEKIEITILGSGSAIPNFRRKNASILFKYEGDYMLLDAGECTQLSLQQIGVSPLKIKRILISHWHADHFGGLIPLIETSHMLGRRKKLTIIGPDADWFVEKLLEISYLDFGFKIKPINAPKDRKKLLVRDKKYKIYSFPLVHSVPNVGYIIKENDHWKFDSEKIKQIPEKLRQKLKDEGEIKIGKKVVKIEDVAKKVKGRKIAYSGDTIPVEDFFKELENGYMIHEATFIDPYKEIKHSSIKEVCELAKKYNIKQIVLTHFSRRYTDDSVLEKTAKSIYDKCIIAKDGMKIMW